MTGVQTCALPIYYAPEELGGGATLFHEHLSFADDFMTRWAGYAAASRAANGVPANPGAGGAGAAGRGVSTPPTGPFFMQDLDLMTEEMTIARHDGIGCLVDGGHPDMGRDINVLRQISTKSGMPIVAGAGLYTQPFYPKDIATMSEEQIVRALVRQCETDPVEIGRASCRERV